MLRVIFGLLALGFLAACASLNEQECRSGDWYEIGFDDGTKGRFTSFFERHIKACTRHGIFPDKSPWLDGREDGLRRYCTPRNAYLVGRSGRRMNDVCTPAETAAFVEANLVGLRYHDITEEIRALEAEIDDIEDAMRELAEDDPLYIALSIDRRQARRSIRRLELRRLRYDAWP